MRDDGRIPRKVVHYSDHDPRTSRGGVESFARNLELVFSDVVFMAPRTIDVDLVRAGRVPVICDNQRVMDWPEDVPVIGFQHGVAREKLKATWSVGHALLSLRQQRAARRPNTQWVACAQWISDALARLYGNRAAHVIHHPVDVSRFDGRLANQGSRLLLHDARSAHKGRRIVQQLARAFPGWRFEPLACPPSEVADRMRTATAFLHLSRYEGNSLVCTEAMAMNLPCLFTRVGVLRDSDGPTDVCVIDPLRAFNERQYLIDTTGSFLESLGTRRYQPRDWVLAHATPQVAIRKWQAVLDAYDRI
jgi:glycosyltransferase involved in cell wall biosynthesis